MALAAAVALLAATTAAVPDAAARFQTGSIRTDRAAYPEPPLPPRPAAGGKYTDAVFGTEIMRVTGPNDGPAPGLGTFYTIWPTFNADGTRLLIRKGVSGDAILKRFYPDTFTVDSGHTDLPSSFGDGLGDGPSWQFAIWSNSDPNVIYALSNGWRKRLMSYNVLSGTWSPLKSFMEQPEAVEQAEGAILFHMTMSEDEDTFAFYVRKGGENPQAIVWRRSTDTVTRFPATGPGSIIPAGLTMNEVDLDKSGRYLTVAIDSPAGRQLQACTPTTPGDPVGQVIDLQTNQIETLYWCDTDDPSGHGGLGRGIIAGQAPFNYGLNKRQLGDTHRFAQMFTPTTTGGQLDRTENFHATLLADSEEWITVGTYDDDFDEDATDYGIFEDEIYQVALDGSQRFRRLAHSRTNWLHKDLPGANELNGYWAIAKPTISHDGRYIAYTSNWEETPENNVVRTDLFILKVPPHSCTPPASPSLIVSEFRLRGPKGPKDEFVELYNKSDAPLTVCAADGSAGWTLAARTAGGAPDAPVFTVPNGTTIPARGHYLAVNRSPGGYSLSNHPVGHGATAVGDMTYVADIGDNVGFALFKTANPANFTLANRLDAVGSTAETNTLYKEGTGYPALTPLSIEYSFYRDNCGKGGSISTFGVCPISTPKDSNNNASDFIFVDTDGNSAGAGQRLGAPNPENLASPVQRNASMFMNNLDPCVSAADPPNRVRDFASDPIHNSTFGTLSIRRTVTNNTGAPVTRLRWRVVDITTFPAPGGIADLRPRTSVDVVQTVDRAPCGSGTSSVTVRGTVVEEPPSQPNGGGFNTAFSAGSVTLAAPLANGASLDVHFLLGIQQTGSFKFLLNVEALP